MGFILWSDTAQRFIWEWSAEEFWSRPIFFIARSKQEADRKNLISQCIRDSEKIQKALYYPGICTQYSSTTCDLTHLRKRGDKGYVLPIVHEDLWSKYEEMRLKRFSLLGDTELRSKLATEVHLLNERLSEGSADLDTGLVAYDTKELAIGYRRQIDRVCSALQLTPQIEPLTGAS